jgi:hypothetical protein
MSVSILAVDDEVDVADMFRQSFRREVRQGQYVLHFACSAEEARISWRGASSRSSSSCSPISPGLP